MLVRLGLAAMPARATGRELYGVALLCGLGFTMSLFIATLASHTAEGLDSAKIGILAGSLLSGIAGYVVLAGAASPHAGRRRRGRNDADEHDTK